MASKRKSKYQDVEHQVIELNHLRRLMVKYTSADTLNKSLCTKIENLVNVVEKAPAVERMNPNDAVDVLIERTYEMIHAKTSNGYPNILENCVQ